MSSKLATIMKRRTAIGTPPRGTAVDHHATTTVMVLLDGSSAITTPMIRAVRIAEALGGNLRIVLAVRPDTTHRHALFAQIVDLLHGMRFRGARDLEAHHGELVEVALAVGHATSPALAIVDAGFGAGNACRLVAELAIPVLVARDARHLEPVLDMQPARDDTRAFDRMVTYFHDASPVEPINTDVMREDVIRELARERDADLVTIGHLRCSWFGRLFRHDLSDRDRCARSLLIVPTADPATRP